MGTQGRSDVPMGRGGQTEPLYNGMTRQQVLDGVAMSLNAIEQRLELLRTKLSRVEAKLRRAG